MTFDTGTGSAVATGLLLLALLSPAPSHAADSLRCRSRIIAVEAIAPAVLAACGEPSYREVWNYYDQSYAGFVGDTEAWTYNFGPNQLLRILRFRNGRVTRIDTEGYGFNATPDGRCSPNDIVEGLSKYRLVSYCGEPALRQAAGYLQPFRRRGRYDTLPPGNFLTPGYREEWTYNFGARYFLRRVMLENGRVVDVEDGERGYDAP